MSEVVLKVDDSGAHIVSAGSEFFGVYRMHSGAMPEPISVEPGGENRVLVCAAARAGTILVTIVYADDSVYDDQAWEVFPGAPLKVLSSETPEEVTVEQLGSELPQVEVLIADSGIAVPELEFLVLNAGTGVRLGSASASDVVLGWRDTRPLSGAPEEFTGQDFLTGGGAEFVESDPDFNGRPSVLWTEEQAGGYRYSGAVAGLWDFLGAAGSFLVMAIVKPPRDRGWGGNAFWRRSTFEGPGLYLSIDGGYRLAAYFYDDGEFTPTVELTSRDEIIEDGTSMVLILLKNESGVQLYRQGVWEILDESVTGSAPPSPTDAVPTIGIPSSSPNGLETNLKIADFRIWKELPSDINETIDEYIEMAVTEYGVDNSVRPGFPWVTGADVMLRANRGVTYTEDSIIHLPGTPTMVGSAIQGWGDTRPEGEADFFGPRTEGEQTYPSYEASDELSGHDVVRSYGATGTVEGSIVGHSLEEPEADALPLYTSEFTLGFISVPTDDEGTNRGGIIVATNSSAGPTDVFVWRLTSSGQLYLLITADGETDLEVTLEVGTQVFDRPYAFMARLGNGSLKLEAWELSSDAYFEVTEPTAWAGTNPPDPLVLFDYPAYYNASQFYDGKSAELFMHPDRVVDSEVRNWISYAKRRYLEVDWSSL